MRKRLPFYCWVLPLLLGAGAWWFVSWITSPRQWVRSFEGSEFVVPNERVPSGKGEEFDQIFALIGERLRFTIAQNRLCIRPSDPGYQELIEIASGRTISRTKYKYGVADDNNELQPVGIHFFFGKQTHEYDRFTVEIVFSPAFLYYLVPSQWELPLSKINWLPEWMNGLRFWLHLRDRTNGKTLIKAKTHHSNNYLLTNQWFIVTGEEEVNGKTIFRVQAFEIPVTIWSPWWGSGVGLVVVIACWVLLWSVARRSAKPVEPSRITFHEQQV